MTLIAYNNETRDIMAIPLNEVESMSPKLIRQQCLDKYVPHLVLTYNDGSTTYFDQDYTIYFQ